MSGDRVSKEPNPSLEMLRLGTPTNVVSFCGEGSADELTSYDPIQRSCLFADVVILVNCSWNVVSDVHLRKRGLSYCLHPGRNGLYHDGYQHRQDVPESLCPDIGGRWTRDSTNRRGY